MIIYYMHEVVNRKLIFSDFIKKIKKFANTLINIPESNKMSIVTAFKGCGLKY